MADLCKMDQALIEQYLDGELGRAEAMKVHEHIDSCSHCKARTELLRLSSELLKDHMEQAVQDADFSGFEQSVLQRLETSKRPGAIKSLVLWIQESLENHLVAWVAATAASVALLLIALLGPWSSTSWNTPSTTHQTSIITTNPDSTRTARADNDVIIDQLEYQGKKSMIFTISKNNTTVIWMYDFDGPGSKSSEGDEI